MRFKHPQKALKALLSFALLFAFAFFFPFKINAEDKYMQGESMDFTLNLEKDGSAHIRETWICYFGGDTITRCRRRFKLPENAYTIQMESITMDGEEMLLLDAPDDSRPEGCAAVYEQDGTLSIEMYLNALNESHEFRFEYTVNDAVILHDDAAEFRWVLISADEPFDIENITGEIVIPYGTEENGLYFWGHGPTEDAVFEAEPENGMVNKFTLSVPSAPKGTLVSVRFAMPTELFPLGSRFEAGSALDSIIAEERQYEATPEPVPSGTAKPDDTPDDDSLGFFGKLRLSLLNFYYSLRYNTADFFDGIYSKFGKVLPYISVALVFAPPFIIAPLSNFVSKHFAGVYIERKLKKLRLKPQNAPEYYRSLPDDMKPAMVYKLTSLYPKDGKIARQKGSAAAAVLMDLTERGIIQCEHNGNETYMSVPPDDAVSEDGSLTDYEKAMLELLREAGGGNPITMKMLNQYIKDNRNWANGINERVKNGIDEEFKALGLTETLPLKKMNKWFYILGSVIFVGLIAFGISEEMGFYSLLIGTPFGLLDMFLVSTLVQGLRPDVCYCNQEGENKHALWQAFARFLDDFTVFDEKELPEIKIWRRYLVYAAALGRSEKVIEKLKITFPQLYEQVVSDSYFYDYDTMCAGFTEVDREISYSIRRSSGSDSGFGSDSGSDYDGGSGGFSGGGGDYDSGSGGGDFD